MTGPALWCCSSWPCTHRPPSSGKVTLKPWQQKTEGHFLSFCLSKNETKFSCRCHRAPGMFSCVRWARLLLLPTDWLSFLFASSCSHRNTLFSDLTDLEQTLLSETLCPDPTNPNPTGGGLAVLGGASAMQCRATRSSARHLCAPGVVCWKDALCQRRVDSVL